MSIRYYEFGPFQIDKLNHALLRDGDTIPLKPKVFDTLLLLVENRERILDKDEMLRRLWPDTVVEESNLSQNVYLLRKALCEETEGAKYIETMPKRGYRFVGGVKEVEADALLSPELVVEEKLDRSLTESGRHPQWLRRPVLVVAVGFILVFGTGFGLYTWMTSRSKSTPRTTQIRSIAVLPFKPLEPSSQDESLGFGMADTLITRLSNLKPLIVRSTSSVRKFTSPNEDAVAAGRELNVDAVLDASIHRAGNQIRITWRLVDVSDGTALAAGIVDKPLDDPLALQDAVAAAVAQELKPQLTGEEKRLLAKRYTENSEAYRLCMLGRYHLTPRIEDWKKALDYFNAAVEKDPDYALAYAGLANAYISLVADSLLPKAEAIPKAKQAAMRALQLDDTLSEAHVASARIMTYYDWDWAGAEREFKRALELNTNSGEAHREYAAYLTNVGRSEQAIAEVKKARELDPLDLLTNFQVAWTLIGARRYDEAISESQKLTETLPNAHFWIGMALLGKGMNEQAIKEFEHVLSYSKTNPMFKASLAYAYAATGKREKAKNILAEFEKLFRQGQSSPYHIAMIYAGLGDKDQTFAWLEKAYSEHSRPLASGINVNPAWDGIRSDSRFENLRRRMGLVQ
ncbi:MAG TPA: winged helix-turn-helix domain-containing protein [Pyrinomonadaceae bacterium]|nr:winged helix-turn-helix domain-containing protein [Pyrinomonadaceae bacterium]